MATKSKTTVSRAKKPTNKKKSIGPSPFKKYLPLIAIVLFAGIGTLLLRQILAANTLSFSLYATHPYASKAGFDSTSTNYYTGAKLCTTGSFCPVGQTLIDMGVSQSGELVAGYGDWNANVDSFGVPQGRVGIVPLNLSTGQWGAITPAGSEALDVIREINGNIYAPTTDPSDTLGSRSGFATNQGGTWHMVFDGTGAVHTLDVASSNGSDLFVLGSKEGTQAQAVAWRSVNGGPFTESVKDISTTTSSGYERYYWGANTNGKMYVKAASTNPATPTRAFDGTSWSPISSNPCSSAIPRLVVNFANKVVCRASGSAVNVFDGSTTKTSTFTSTIDTMYDMYVKDTNLYVLSSSGIYRTDSNLLSWTFLGTAPTEARSIAVYNNYVYLGGLNGKIFKSSALDGTTGTTTTPTTPTTTAISGTSSSPTELVLESGATGQVTVTGTGLLNASVTVSGLTTQRLSSSDTQIVVAVDESKLLRKLKLKPGQSVSVPVQLISSTGVKGSAPSIMAKRP